jgi:DNA-directed RNA polymerase beta' subunit
MDISFIPDEAVKRCCTFSVNERFDLYDERFGSIKSTSKCTVCKKTEATGCYGHYGSLYLGLELFHPMFLSELSNAVNSMCQHCSQPHDTTAGHTKTGIRCKRCNLVTYVDYNIFPTQSYLMKRRYGSSVLTPTQCRKILQDDPRGKYIISYIIVPPTGIRPPEDVEWPSDISRTYSRMVDSIKYPSRGLRHLKRINDLYNSIVGYLKKDGMIKALSSKSGIFRTLMLGKRLNRSARLVIVGDPYLDVDQISVPKKVAQTIRVEERVWNGNVDLMKTYAREGKLWWTSEPEQAYEDHVVMGRSYDRELVDGDLIMFNRQPSLSKFSLLAFRVRIVSDENVFAFNPAVTASFNADFDGDEMNIYAGYGLEARAELLELCHINKNIYDLDTRKVYVSPIQDVITGVYMMTRNGETDIGIPPEINYSSGPVVITNGKLVQGVIDKSILCRDLILHVGINYGTDLLVKFIRDVQLRVIEWLNTQGFTIRLKDCMWDKGDRDEYRRRKDDRNVQNWVLATSMNKYHTSSSNNPLSVMLRSGSKGKDIGAAQMAISVGQQHIDNKRSGYITNGYIDGLNPQEYFCQASASLSGIIDIGTNVASIGYANRRVSKLTTDVVLGYNGVIGTRNQVVQFE